MNYQPPPPGKRVAIVTGLRTPFAKQGTAYRDLSALDLGTIVVTELLQRSGITPQWVQRVVYGQVIPSLRAPNIAREVVLNSGLPKSVDAYSVSRACATSYQSTISVAEAIMTGTIDCAIAGGADSASDVPMVVSKPLTERLMRLSKAKSIAQKLSALQGLRLKDLAPIPPALKEPSTGLTMGESAEKMAKENKIPRQEQDEFAHRSHSLAAKAWDSGLFADEVMQVFVPPKFKETIREDNLVRKDSQIDKYSTLRPVFDRKHGTVTAGNSSPLTDGASALIAMREDRAKAEGLSILGFVKSYAFAALDPGGQMLMGPSYATPLALDRAKLTLKDMDLVDMHEAFAAQILSNTQAFESKKFAEEKLGRSDAIGKSIGTSLTLMVDLFR